MIETTILIAFITLLTLLSGFCSGSEAALFSLSITQIKTYKTDANPRKKLIATLLSQPRDLLVTIFMINTMVNILLQNVVSHLFGQYASWLLTIGVPLLLTLVFGEIIPKYLGLQNNAAFSYQVAPIIDRVQSWLSPIRRATVAITTPISRVLFFYLKKEESISKEELEHVLKTSQEHGVFDEEEGELIIGYLELQDTMVKELMNPRGDILIYDIEEPLTKLTYLFVDQELTRVPVCEKNLDNMLGIITAKQYFLHRDSIAAPKDLIPLLSKPFFVPETTSARILMRRLNEKREILAVVVDEYGSISGLITREDLIEVVIGEITDPKEKNDLYTRSGANEIIASGKLELSEFNEIFDVELDSPGNMVTIGGWLTERLGEIPKGGTKYEIDPFLFQVLASSPSRIRRLYIRKIKK